MGEVDAFSISGLKCYFSSNDHYPQHFEVQKRGYWVIRVYIIPSTRKRGLIWKYKYHWRGDVSAVEEKAILEMVCSHKRELLSEWNTKVCVARERKRTHEQKRKPGGARGA